MQKNRIVPDVLEKRNTWIEKISGAKAEHQVYSELLDNADISYMYLPPYSLDLNPIEKMWSKMNAILWKSKIRVASELPETVKTV